MRLFLRMVFVLKSILSLEDRVNKYIDRTTPEAFPTIRKFFRAYMLSLLGSTSVKESLSELDRTTGVGYVSGAQYFLNTFSEKPVDYIFLFIGDGLSSEIIQATNSYLLNNNEDILNFSVFPCRGSITTFSADSAITDSAAAATALALGEKTNNSYVGSNVDTDKLYGIGYDLKRAGYNVGIATNVPISHATPAPFYARGCQRDQVYTILKQIPLSGFDYFAGSGLDLYDNVQLVDVMTDFINAGYDFMDFNDFGVSSSDKVLLVEDLYSYCLTYAKDRVTSPQNYRFTLTDFVQYGINHLTKNNSRFFFMIESGIIDWTAHDNDTDGTIAEVIDLSKAVQMALDFKDQHPNTLIIVTSDHDTGGAVCLDAPEYINWTSANHTGVSVPVFATGVNSGFFSGHYDNTDIPKKILRTI